MNRRKTRFIIIILSLFFFSISTAVNYSNIYKMVRSNFRENPYDIANLTEDYMNTDTSIYEKLDFSGISVADYITFRAESYMSGGTPHQTAVLDADGNILSVGGTSVFIDSVYADNKHCWLINLEEYMTPSLHKEMSKFIHFNSSAEVKYISFYLNDGTYIPVEICLEGWNTKKVSSFFFTDCTPNKTFKDNLFNINFNMWGEHERLSEKGYYKMIRQRLFDDVPFLQSRYTTTTATHVAPIRINGEFDYQLYISIKENPFVRTLFSSYFSFIEINLILGFVLFTIAAICLSSKYLNKKEELEKSKRAFISAAAHELKTPLAVIQNQCECILEGAVNDKKDEYIKSVYDEALRMNDIVTSLLTFNRLSSTDKIERESCNLTALVKEEVNKYLPFARSEGAEITLEAEKDIAVNCNPKLMALAVDNYLSNAVKYTTGEKKITVTLKREKNCFILEVFNTCEPLSTETVENIWELLERRDISRTRDGSSTGMGLPICKRIFECHSYSFYCKNTNNGVVFAVKGNL